MNVLKIGYLVFFLKSMVIASIVSVLACKTTSNQEDSTIQSLDPNNPIILEENKEIRHRFKAYRKTENRFVYFSFEVTADGNYTFPVKCHYDSSDRWDAGRKHIRCDLKIKDPTGNVVEPVSGSGSTFKLTKGTYAGSYNGIGHFPGGVPKIYATFSFSRSWSDRNKVCGPSTEIQMYGDKCIKRYSHVRRWSLGEAGMEAQAKELCAANNQAFFRWERTVLVSGSTKRVHALCIVKIEEPTQTVEESVQNSPVMGSLESYLINNPETAESLRNFYLDVVQNYGGVAATYKKVVANYSDRSKALDFLEYALYEDLDDEDSLLPKEKLLAVFEDRHYFQGTERTHWEFQRMMGRWRDFQNLGDKNYDEIFFAIMELEGEGAGLKFKQMMDDLLKDLNISKDSDPVVSPAWNFLTDFEGPISEIYIADNRARDQVQHQLWEMLDDLRK